MPDEKLFDEFDEKDPRYQVRILAREIERMKKDHDREVAEHVRERAEDALVIAGIRGRMIEIARLYNRGLGGVAVIIALGVVIGFLAAYGKLIFAPWAKGSGS